MKYLTKSEIKVRYSETDAMGIVHHSRYYPWFELARDEYIKSLGFKYSEMEKEGLLIPLIESEARYKLGARYDDELSVTCRLIKMTYVRCTFMYEVIRKNDGALLTTGKTSHAFCNKNLKPINLKKHYPKYYEKLITLICSEEEEQ